MAFFGYTILPADDWGRRFASRRYARAFTAGWQTVLSQLQREIRKLGGDQATIQLCLRSDADMRFDGLGPKADARFIHPGVRVLFPSKHGELRYQTDHFTDWHQNVRAIGMTLERLRLVSLHGVVEGGEQYVGSRKQLPYIPVHSMTVDEAALFVATLVDGDGRLDDAANRIINRGDAWDEAYRAAARKVHPDVDPARGEEWTKLQEAKVLIEAVHARRRH